jgi:hypothetical protein
MSRRACSVTLAAIARDEGAYLLDWVHHHLRLGFDEIDLFLNGTSDASVEVLEAVREVEPRLHYRHADEMLARCLATGRNFQHRAYAQLAKRAAQRGATHVAFLDLDEYWTPRDLRSGIHDFVPDDDEVNVVSFGWWLDVPDPGAAPFRHPWQGRPALQADPHVKSVVRLDHRVHQQRTHTARTHAGRRLLVREPFPLRDERAQQWGSLVPPDWLAERADALPEAFVLHAVHRSPVEYLGSLARGLRQTGSEIAVKANRPGFLPSPAPRVAFPDLPGPLAEHARDLAAFRERVGADAAVEASRRALVGRGEALVVAAAADVGVLQQLRAPARGLALPALDRAHPGWDRRLPWCVDAVAPTADGLRVTGWAYDERGRPLELAVRPSAGRDARPVAATWLPRPDVATTHPGAPLACGFAVEVPDPPEDPVLRVRPVGAALWDEWPL